METKTTGWRYPVDVVEQFQDFCSEKGAGMEASAAAALFIWQFLPAAVRDMALSEVNGKPRVDRKWFEVYGQSLDDAVLGRPYNHDGKHARNSS